MADSGDNPTAGGIGDRADILEAILKTFADVEYESIESNLKDL